MSERIEYGVKLTWPDGESQIDVCDSFLADTRIEWHNTPGNSTATARLMRRTVTTSPWEPA